MIKIIFFQAHPDDLDLFCCHLIHYLSQKKEKYAIKIASMTRGEFGTPFFKQDHFKGKRLGNIRTKELYNSLKIQGIEPEQVHFFDVMDGHVKFKRDIIEMVKNYLEREKPDIIFTPAPLNTYYRHWDHMNIGKIVYYIYDKIIITLKPKLYYYAPLDPTFKWPFKKQGVDFTYKLIYTHKSQIWAMQYTRPIYKIVTRIHAIHLKGWKFAEAYRRTYYREEKHKNRRLNRYKSLLNLISVIIWPKTITDYSIK